MGNTYYAYTNESYSCKHCGWTGLGKDVTQGDMFDAGFEVECPNCNERFPGLIQFPTIEETLEKGSDEDKRAAKAVNAFRQKWLSSLVTDINQLPDLNGNLMVFELTDVEENGENYIAIWYGGKMIWKEIRAYEYYERFIELGEMLKGKFGDKMIDFVPNVDARYLYGDRLSSIYQVEQFRNKLQARNSKNTYK